MSIASLATCLITEVICGPVTSRATRWTGASTKLPAASVTRTVTSKPVETGTLVVKVAVQAPPVTVPLPTTVAPLKSVTTAPGYASETDPVRVGRACVVQKVPEVGTNPVDATTRPVGAVLSTVTLTLRCIATLPERSVIAKIAASGPSATPVNVAVRVRLPSPLTTSLPVGVTGAPLLSAVTVRLTGAASEPASPATPEVWRLSAPSTTIVSGVLT